MTAPGREAGPVTPTALWPIGVAAGRPSPLAVAVEAVAAVRSQRVASVVTVLIVAGMIVLVMLTTGRTVGAEQRVLSSFDEAGTRTVEVRAERDAGLSSDVLHRIAHIDGIEWSAAFSAAVDATNTALPDGARVAVRKVYGSDLEPLGVPRWLPEPGRVAFGSPRALAELGLPDVAGSITTTTGTTHGMAGRLDAPRFLDALEPVILVPQPEMAGGQSVTLLLVIAERPDLVAPVAEAVVSVLAVDDPGKVTVRTSAAIAQLRGIVQSQLGVFGRGLVIVVVAVTGILVAVILGGLIMLRRRDFGRRRALGATRGLIVALILVQTALLAVCGVSVGAAASSVALVVAGDPLPDGWFVVAVAVLTVATALAAAVVPALVAARREPIRELRVP